MEQWQRVAAYIAAELTELQKVDKIDLMTLNKVMYFAQREAYIRLNAPLFNKNIFHAAQYGPVIIKLKELLKKDEIGELPSEEWLGEHKQLLTYVVAHYGNMSPHTLSSLSHSEISWRNAHERSKNVHFYHRISDADIKIDALKIIMREKRLKSKAG